MTDCETLQPRQKAYIRIFPLTEDMPELGTQDRVLALEKHDDYEEAEGEEGEIFHFLNLDGNIAPYASH
uniref:Uncharacterized protein n=1 Tax=Tanacetum cinerariifolium TaxID=118510 RepID=A0A6L2JYL8_TANCI|nr:hypothetical protein [Tanacetum cinerariifolium]